MRKLILALLLLSSSLSGMDDMEWEGFADIVDAIERYSTAYTNPNTNAGRRRRLIYEVHHLMHHPFFQKGKFSLYLRPGRPPFLDFNPPQQSEERDD